jgi:hypothetical protein
MMETIICASALRPRRSRLVAAQLQCAADRVAVAAGAGRDQHPVGRFGPGHAQSGWVGAEVEGDQVGPLVAGMPSTLSSPNSSTTLRMQPASSRVSGRSTFQIGSWRM